MADFEVTLQDGRKFIVADVPEDSTEEQLLATAEAQANQPFVQPPPPEGFTAQGRPIPVTGEGMARSFLQGPFGFGDEAVGNLTAGIMSATGQIPEGMSFGDIRDRAIDIERQDLEAFREDSPVLAGGSEFAGGVVSSLPFTPASLSGNLALRTLQAGGIGAGLGALFGIGAGEGGLQSRLANALVPALVGGTVGGFAPSIGVVGRGILNRLRGTGAQARAAGMSTPVFENLSDIAEAEGQRGAQRLASVGDDAMLADAGPMAQQATDFLARTPGPSSRIVQDAIGGRVEQAAQRAMGALDDVLGQPQGIRATAREIAQRTAPARADAYEAAYRQTVDYASDAGQDVLRVLQRVPDDIRARAIADANRLAQLEGVPMAAISAGDNAPSVMQLDFLKRALNEIAEGEVNNVGRRTGLGTAVSNVARDLRDATAAAVPGYREALRLGGDNIVTQQALELGENLLRAGTRREAINEFIERASVDGQLPADVIDAFRVGIRQNIDDTLANVRTVMSDPNLEAREARKLLSDLSSRAARDKVTAVLGPDEAARLFDELDNAVTAFNLRASTAMRSPTQPRAAAQERFSQPTALEAAQNLQFPTAVREALAPAIGGGRVAGQARMDARLAEMAQALTGPRGIEAQNLLAALQRGALTPPQMDAARNRIQQLFIAGAGAGAQPVTTAVQNALR